MTVARRAHRPQRWHTCRSRQEHQPGLAALWWRVHEGRPDALGPVRPRFEGGRRLTACAASGTALEASRVGAAADSDEVILRARARIAPARDRVRELSGPLDDVPVVVAFALVADERTAADDIGARVPSMPWRERVTAPPAGRSATIATPAAPRVAVEAACPRGRDVRAGPDDRLVTPDRPAEVRR